MTDPDEITKKLLLGVERDIHRHGWDQDPFLAVLHQLTPNTISFQDTGVAIQGHPGIFIANLGKAHLTYPDLAKHLLHAYGKPETFYGLAYCCEAWGRADTPEAAAARRKAKKMIADIEGSYELRFISVVDVYGNTTLLLRMRGQKPTLEFNEEKGRVFEGLADMVYSAVQLMPDNADKIAGLDQLRKRLADDAHLTRATEV